MTKHIPFEHFKPCPAAKSKSKPFLSWTCDYDVPLRGLPAGFVAEDPHSNCMFLAVAFIGDLPISLGAYCDRREAALAIVDAHHGGESA
jgi:hypothetical protein